MRYCFNCHRVTLGEPLYCTFCGRSYEEKLCPRSHINPRHAEVCSQCGSRDLSTPAPRIPLWLRPVLLLVSKLPGIVLLGLTGIYLFFAVQTLLVAPEHMLRLMLLFLPLSMLWLLYLHMPISIGRRLQSRIGKPRSKR